MNKAIILGRLTKDPEIRYTQGDMAIARFSVAIDRGKDKYGESKGTDFPNVVAFGKTAENCERYLSKGRKVAIEGRIQTGSYTKDDGTKVYTTDIIGDRVEFIDFGNKESEKTDIPKDFEDFIQDDDIPF